MINDPVIVRGLLGWSNKRPGVEFYRWDPKIIPRFGSDWGDLLARERGVSGHEGSPVIVVVLSRNWDESRIMELENAIREILP